MTSICIFCGSSAGRDTRHIELAAQTGGLIAKRGGRLIYGGGGLGLMGAAARAAHKGGAEVLGIIPQFLSEAEKTLTEVPHRFVANMHERKLAMLDESDAFIVLPGGIGTLEEAIEVLSWMRLNLHQKPLVFLDNTGYWAPVLKTLHHFVSEGFAPESFIQDLHHAQTPQAALDIIDYERANPRVRVPLKIHTGELKGLSQ